MKGEAVKALENLAFSYFCNRRRKHYYEDETANGLTKCIIDYINMQGFSFAYRVNSTGIYDAKKGLFRKSNTIKGIADITAIRSGICWQIEIKIGKDRMSEEQKDFKNLVQAANGIYIVATSFENFLEQWQGSKVLPYQQLNIFS